MGRLLTRSQIGSTRKWGDYLNNLGSCYGCPLGTVEDDFAEVEFSGTINGFKFGTRLESDDASQIVVLLGCESDVFIVDLTRSDRNTLQGV